VSSGDQREQTAFGAVLATTVAQVGCVTVIVIVGALALGIALDSRLDTKPLFTLLFVLVSIPLSLYLLVRVAYSSVQKLTPPVSTEAGGVREPQSNERPSEEKE
jgi:multisubunit Na+/H+ antiporter MnhG subunit